MSTDILERPRFVEFSRDEVHQILDNNDIGLEDCDYLSAVTINPVVFEVQGVATATNLPTKSLRLYYIGYGETGFFQAKGGERLVFLNENDLADYELISDLHTVPDACIYLALTEAFESDRDFERINEWFRDETHPNHFKED